MSEPIVVGIVLVLVLGIGAQWLAWRFKLPSILLLLIFGFLAGPVTGLLNPDMLQGEWVFAFVSLSVGIILFEAGLSLRMSELREVGKAIRNLITYGVVITWALAALAAYYIAGFSLEISILIGAILTVTGPTVIIPLLRHVRPIGRVGAVARWEGITIDPIGAILSVFVLEALLILNAPGGEPGGVQSAVLHTIEGLFTVMVVGAGVSFLGVALLIMMLRHRLVPDYLQNALSLMAVVGAFALSNLLHPESGLLTATIMGIIMANQPYVSVRQIEEFKEDLRVLLLPALFILLSARLELSVLQYIDIRAIGFLAALILLIRPINVVLSSLGTNLDWKEQTFLAWLAPRGVVATAIASLFGLRLAGIFPDAAALVPVVFFIIVGTVGIYGLSLGPLARWLGLADQNPQGILIVGAHSWARKMAKALYDLGLNVLVIDSNARNVQRAREEQLLAEHANALSENIIDQLDLSGIGRLAALTPNAEVNALAALHFNEVFESADIYQLANRTERPHEREFELPRHLRGHLLFGEGVTYASLDERFAGGDEIQPFQLSEERTYENLQDEYGEGLQPLFLVRNQTHLLIFSEDDAPAPMTGDTLLAVVSPTGKERDWKPVERDTQKMRDEDEAFRQVVESASFIDIDNEDSYETLVDHVAQLLTDRVQMEPNNIAEMFLDVARGERIVVSGGAALPHFRIGGIDQPELVMARCRDGFCIFPLEDQMDNPASEPVYALFFLVSPEAYPSRHLRVLALLAGRIDDDDFLERWLSADNEEEIKEIILQDIAYPVGG